MTHKIKVEIYKPGEHTEFILKVVAVNNSGVREIGPLALQAYLQVRAAVYNSTICDLAVLEDMKLHISSDGGKTYSLTLEWVEVHELSEIEKEINSELEHKNADDLKGVNI